MGREGKGIKGGGIGLDSGDLKPPPSANLPSLQMMRITYFKSI